MNIDILTHSVYISDQAKIYKKSLTRGFKNKYNESENLFIKFYQ